MRLLKEAFLMLKYRMLFSAFLGVITGMLNGIIISLINHPSGFYLTFSVRTLFFWIILTSFVLTILSKSFLIHISQSLVYELRKLVCDKIMQTNLLQIENLGKSKIYAVLNQDLGTLSSALLIVPQLLINLTIVFSCCIYLDFFSSFFSWLIGAVLLSSLMFFYSYDRLFVKYKFEEVRERADDLYKSYQGMVEGFKELKLNTNKCGIFRNNKLLRSAREMRNTTSSALCRYTLIQNFWDNMFYLFIGILVFWGVRSQVHNIMIAKIVVVLLFMMAPLKGVILVLPQLRQAIVSIRKIASLELTREKILEPKSSFLTLKEIVIEKVTFHYENFEMHPISMTLVPGQITYIIGKNGSGKSTLVKLIAGLYRPNQGKIWINGELLVGNKLIRYRNQISAIFTDFYLFDITPMDLNSLRAKELMLRLQLEGKLLFEDGHINNCALSDGQRKRLALLHAYLEDRQMLIFDEWAADQDPEYKKIFYQELLPELKNRGKIVIVISHDDRYFHIADQVIQLSESKKSTKILDDVVKA